jgi:hypothetical protein
MRWRQVIQRIGVSGQPRQKVSKDLHLSIQASEVVSACYPSYLGGIGRRIIVRAGLSKKLKTPPKKITKAK